MKARARITLRSTAAGGREGPIQSGYLTLVGIDGVLSSASAHLLNVDLMQPGEVHEIELRFADPNYFGSRIHLGVRITLNEGTRTIGEGEITEIL